MTSVNIHFNAVDESHVNLVIEQTGFVNKEECQQHEYAWMSCLEKLAVLANKQKTLS